MSKKDIKNADTIRYR